MDMLLNVNEEVWRSVLEDEAEEDITSESEVEDLERESEFVEDNSEIELEELEELEDIIEGHEHHEVSKIIYLISIHYLLDYMLSICSFIE